MNNGPEGRESICLNWVRIILTQVLQSVLTYWSVAPKNSCVMFFRFRPQIPLDEFLKMYQLQSHYLAVIFKVPASAMLALNKITVKAIQWAVKSSREKSFNHSSYLLTSIKWYSWPSSVSFYNVIRTVFTCNIMIKWYCLSKWKHHDYWILVDTWRWQFSEKMD